MRILFFGPLSDLSGPRNGALPARVRTIREVRDWLAVEDPKLGRALDGSGIGVAVNGTVVDDDCAVSAADEIAFMSPMSGG